jgi:hypothetical protein
VRERLKVPAVPVYCLAHVKAAAVKFLKYRVEWPFRNARRCNARTSRTNRRCQLPAMRGHTKCRVHGSLGAPFGVTAWKVVTRWDGQKFATPKVRAKNPDHIRLRDRQRYLEARGKIKVALRDKRWNLLGGGDPKPMPSLEAEFRRDQPHPQRKLPPLYPA